MQILDDLEKIRELDKGHILASIEHLPEQIDEAWRGVSYINFPKTCFDAKNIVIAGMGGSGLGGDVIHQLMFDKLRTPVEVVNGYSLPNYVGHESLVILSSYSGNTEETIASFHDALKKRATIVGISTGGKLGELLQKENLACYKIDPKGNPSGQPRMGLGYSIVGIMAILTKCGFLSLEPGDLQSLMIFSEKIVKEFGVRIPIRENIAKRMAEKLAGKIPVLISSEHLVGVTHVFRNQINENAKNFSFAFKISEANHHLIEGLKFPHNARNLLHFLFFESNNYHLRNLKRYGITQDVVNKNGYEYDIYKTVSRKKLEEVFEVLIFGSYISFYLAILHGIDPSPIPWVDYFKQKMA